LRIIIEGLGLKSFSQDIVNSNQRSVIDDPNIYMKEMSLFTTY